MRNAECSITHSALRIPHSALRTSTAYTLLELLTVIVIMGIIAAIALPTLRGLKPNAKVAATRDLLDAVGRARQLAISKRTTVYMVFVPTNFWTAPAASSWKLGDWSNATNLCDKQLIGYAYVCLRSVGDQPGAHNPQYLSSWRTLSQGAFIPLGKFWQGLTITNANSSSPTIFPVLPFAVTNNIPFPSETNRPGPYVPLPYIAFDGMGQLVSGQPGQPELIPLTEGSVSVARDANTKVALLQPPQVNEVPAGNTVDNYSLVWIDRATGRAHVERRKVQ